MSELDLEAIKKEWLNQCGPHDFGLVEYGCNCASGDYRPVMFKLVLELERLRAELTRYHQLHDFLDERVKSAMPVMLAEYVIADGPLPTAFPGLDAVVIYRALEQLKESADA